MKRFAYLVLAMAWTACGPQVTKTPAPAPAPAPAPVRGHELNIRFDTNALSATATGRLFVLIHDAPEPQPKDVTPIWAMAQDGLGGPYAPLFGMDVSEVAPGDERVLRDPDVAGYPFAQLADLPEGTYYAQAVFHRYTLFQRADGHKIWGPMDQWEGQQFHRSPGNLFSSVVKLEVRSGEAIRADFVLDQELPPIKAVPDTRFTKRIRFKSKLLSEFWGRDIDLGATIQLPSNYYKHPNKRFPVFYHLGHFFEKDNWVIPEKRPEVPAGTKLPPRHQAWLKRKQGKFDAWQAKDAPGLVVISLQSPNVYYDASHFVDSKNSGPYRTALFQELLPKLEAEFRIVSEGWGRAVGGGSLGGWASAGLQIQRPTEFGGAWIACPDPLSFSSFYLIDLYSDENAFLVPGKKWRKVERPASRANDGMIGNTHRGVSQLHRALGSRGRSGELWDDYSASFGPVGKDGYPEAIWDHKTGVINKAVIKYWRDNDFDLLDYAKRNWPKIGKDLVGKLHFSCGDMDNFYLNLAMYKMETFLEQTKAPYYGGTFFYGRPLVGHENVYRPKPHNFYFQEIVNDLAKRAPKSVSTKHWNLPPKGFEPIARPKR